MYNLMEKQSKQTSIYSTSKAENHLLQELSENELEVFEPMQIKRLTGYSTAKVNNTLQQLLKKQKITRIKKSLYAFNENIPANAFIISLKAFEPAYISFWSALSYYGFTEQQPVTVQVVTRKRSSSINTGQLKAKATHFKKELFFGYTKINNIVMAEPEKALLDSIMYPKKAGGMEEIIKCFQNAYPKINKTLLLKYLRQIKSKTLNARFGFIFEELFNKTFKLQTPSTYVKLNPEKPCSSKRSKKWMININDKIK